MLRPAPNVCYLDHLYQRFRLACLDLGLDLYHYTTDDYKGPAVICDLESLDLLGTLFMGVVEYHTHGPEHVIVYPSGDLRWI